MFIEISMSEALTKNTRNADDSADDDEDFARVNDLFKSFEKVPIAFSLC